MDTSLLERGGRGGKGESKGGGLTQEEADDGLYLFLLCIAGHPLYNGKVLDHLVQPLAALKLMQFDVT